MNPGSGSTLPGVSLEDLFKEAEKYADNILNKNKDGK